MKQFNFYTATYNDAYIILCSYGTAKDPFQMSKCCIREKITTVFVRNQTKLMYRYGDSFPAGPLVKLGPGCSETLEIHQDGLQAFQHHPLTLV